MFVSFDRRTLIMRKMVEKKQGMNIAYLNEENVFIMHNNKKKRLLQDYMFVSFDEKTLILGKMVGKRFCRTTKAQILCIIMRKTSLWCQKQKEKRLL